MDNQKMLNEIRKATDMGIVGIDSVADVTPSDELRQRLMEQRAEYQNIYDEADRLLDKLGGKPENLSRMAKTCARMASSMKQTLDGSSARVAEMMVEGNTKGLIKSYRCKRRLNVTDPQTRGLAEKLLQTEVHNIEQMKKYL